VEQKYRDIIDAYKTLSDPDKRAKYDSGEDPDEQQQQGGPFYGFQGFQGFPGGFPFGGGQQFTFHFGN